MKNTFITFCLKLLSTPGLFFLNISLNQEKALKHVYCQINSN